MNRYLKIYRQFIKSGFAYFTAYRSDWIFNLFVNAVWLSMIFLILNVIFSQTNTIAGWNKQEVYLLSMMWVLIDEIAVLFFAENLSQISNLIVDGTLDTILIKPLGSLFVITFRYFLFRALYRIVMEGSLVAWILLKFNFNFNWRNVVAGIGLFVVALIVNYSLRLIMNTFSFWFLRIENINEAFGAINTMGKYPIEIFPSTLKIIILTALPIAFQAYIPTAALIGHLPFYGILYAVVFSLLLFFIAVKFWNFALKRYSSASS